MMQYKGYVGKIEVDPEADLIHGEVLGLRDVITFQGHTPAEAEKAFHESVDDYLSFCKERGELPEKPYSGKFMLRIDPLVHRLISMVADAAKVSLNAWINHAILKEVQAELPAAKEVTAGRTGRGGSRRFLLSVSQAQIAGSNVFLGDAPKVEDFGLTAVKSKKKGATRDLYVGNIRRRPETHTKVLRAKRSVNL